MAFGVAAGKVRRPSSLRILLRDEFQRDAVIAVAQTGRLGPVVEHVPLMPAAAHAVVFGARINELEVLLGREPVGNQREETGPTRSALEFHLRGEKRQRASG